MYAVIESGGKQHRVSEGDVVKLELLTAEPGQVIDFEKVLFVSNDGDLKIGAPYVDGGKVSAEVVTHGRHKKIKIVKFSRRKHHQKETGHRQWYTEVKITAISA